jgi:hypothetical protein
MDKIYITPYNVVDKTELPEMAVDQVPTDGDALEIRGETYYVCQFVQEFEAPVIGVIPLVVKNPSHVSNIKDYIECLSIAHRRVLYKNASGICDLESCDEMIIT